MSRFFRLLIGIEAISPAIWRRISLRHDALLTDLHQAICDFGWSGSAGWEVRSGTGELLATEDRRSTAGPPGATTRPLASLLRRHGDRLRYLYDLEEPFLLEVVHEGTLQGPDEAQRCLFDGARSFPPEGCGGPEGYRRLCKSPPKSDSRPGSAPEDEQALALGDWRPDRFDLERERERWNRDQEDEDRESLIDFGEELAELQSACADHDRVFANCRAALRRVRDLAETISDPRGIDDFWALIGLVAIQEDMGFGVITDERSRPALEIRDAEGQRLALYDPHALGRANFRLHADFLASRSLGLAELQDVLNCGGLAAQTAVERGGDIVLRAGPIVGPGLMSRVLDGLSQLAARPRAGSFALAQEAALN